MSTDICMMQYYTLDINKKDKDWKSVGKFGC